MPKRIIAILIAFLSVLTLTGCRSSKPSLEVVPHDDNTITVTADKAGISGVGGAGITIADNQQLVIDSALSKGSIQLKLFRDDEPAGVDASLDEILHTDEMPALDVTVNSAGTTGHSLQPGEYTLFVNVLEKTTGNITLSAKWSNRDGAALRYIAEQLSRRPETVKLLILVSDGQPADTGYYGTAAVEDLCGIKPE